ncbi:MAG: DUF2585 family protein [Rhizobiales bacterium]|nr:DUF2585 family protein [Hyphomicrobiales bacterium]
MGQPAIDPDGATGVWGDGSSTSRLPLDWYSGSHVVHGFLFYWLTWLIFRRWSVDRRGLVAMLVEAAWEVVENTPWVIDRYRDVTVSGDYVGDTVLNSVFDLWAMLVGFWLAARLPVWLTVALAIALELAALLAIRDNLTLNVLMLLWPVDAIRVWQAGG